MQINYIKHWKKKSKPQIKKHTVNLLKYVVMFEQ